MHVAWRLWASRSNEASRGATCLAVCLSAASDPASCFHAACRSLAHQARKQRDQSALLLLWSNLAVFPAWQPAHVLCPCWLTVVLRSRPCLLAFSHRLIFLPQIGTIQHTLLAGIVLSLSLCLCLCIRPPFLSSLLISAAAAAAAATGGGVSSTEKRGRGQQHYSCPAGARGDTGTGTGTG